MCHRLISLFEQYKAFYLILVSLCHAFHFPKKLGLHNSAGTRYSRYLSGWYGTGSTWYLLWWGLGVGEEAFCGVEPGHLLSPLFSDIAVALECLIIRKNFAAGIQK